MRTPRTWLGLIVLCCMVALASCGGGEGDAQDRPTTDSESFVQVKPDSINGNRTFVQLPTGRLDLTVTEPRSTVPAEDAADAQEHVAAKDQAYVGLSWQFSPGEGVPPWQGQLVEGPEQRIQLSLVAGDKSYPLGDARRTIDTPSDIRASGDFFLAVDGADGDDLQVEVTFADATQSVDPRTGEREAGVATPLYQSRADPRLRDCSQKDWSSRGQVDVECGWYVTTVPYVAGQGWSEQGWTVVKLETRASTFSLGSGSYSVQDISDETTMGGADPVASLTVSDQPGFLSELLVFEAAPEKLHALRRVEGRLAEGEGPERTSIALEAGLRPERTN